MPYAVEGETITPAVLSEEGWSVISGKYERARQTRIRKKEERLCLTQPEAGSTTPGPAQQTGKSSLVTNHNKPSTRRRRPPLPRLPEDDRKVVVRPSNLNLRMTTPGQLLKAICEQLNLPPQEIFAKDRLRINPYNNTFTISTPVKERADAYRSLPGFAMNNQEYPVTAYFPTPEHSVRVVISGALGNETPDEILHYCITENPELPIVNARRMGRSRAAVITFEGTKPPKEMIFQAGLFTCHPFKERVETCLNCRRVGHRADVCYRPKSQRCHRCGEEHPPPEEGEPPNCEAKCIICERPHVTGSRNCKHRFVEKRKKLQAKGPPTGDRYSLLSSEDDDNPGRRSRSRTPSSRRRRSESRSRDRSISYPPLDDRGRNSSRSKSNERKKPPSSRGNSTTQNADKQAYKAALGLPINTSTDKLLQLGLHNTLDELTEAHRRMQELRLARTNAGRAVLRRLGINAAPLNAGTRKIPSNVRKTITVKPLPKNMHPAHHEGRRRARAQALAKKFEGRTDVVYVDAAAYLTPKKAYAIAAVTEEGQLVANATVPTNSSEIAEEAAIALALTNSQARVIVSDSKAAIGNFAKGRISPISFGILKTYPKNRQDVELVWVPAHTSNPGNEAAHDKARGSIGRAVDDNSDVGLTGDGLNTYHEITQHYRLERLTFPPPHKNLTKEQELLWRQLQTKTLPNPAVLSHAYPDRFKPDCSKCGGKATVDHIFWDCPADPPPLSLQRLAHPGPWENLPLSSDLETQIQAVTRAQEVAASLH
ncbi:hypothetical protein HPB47_020346 [Ixodes persulcatus]|uniref:Uncharacterized protein n=1 Tax=Ixodes persulcatus TaxID=34615 RepID=A0AC60QFW2_IXOPE|nr:hypothetical protein HPB47_020346 [Ixodes persulcatus]